MHRFLRTRLLAVLKRDPPGLSELPLRTAARMLRDAAQGGDIEAAAGLTEALLGCDYHYLTQIIQDQLCRLTYPAAIRAVCETLRPWLGRQSRERDRAEAFAKELKELEDNTTLRGKIARLLGQAVRNPAISADGVEARGACVLYESFESEEEARKWLDRYAGGHDARAARILTEITLSAESKPRAELAARRLGRLTEAAAIEAAVSWLAHAELSREEVRLRTRAVIEQVGVQLWTEPLCDLLLSDRCPPVLRRILLTTPLKPADATRQLLVRLVAATDKGDRFPYVEPGWLWQAYTGAPRSLQPLVVRVAAGQLEADFFKHLSQQARALSVNWAEVGESLAAAEDTDILWSIIGNLEAAQACELLWAQSKSKAAGTGGVPTRLLHRAAELQGIDAALMRCTQLELIVEWRMPSSVRGALFAPDAGLLAVRHDQGIDLLDTFDRKPIHRIDARDAWCMAFHQTAGSLAVGRANGTLVLHNPITGRVSSETAVSDGGVRSLAFSADGSWLVVTADTPTQPASLWRGRATDSAFDTLAADIAYKWDRIAMFDGLSQPGPVGFSGDEPALALVDAEGAVRVYDIATDAVRFERGHGSRVRAFKFIAGQEAILVGREDGVLELIGWGERARGQQRELRVPGRISALGTCTAQEAIVLYDSGGLARADLVSGETRSILQPSNEWAGAAFFDGGRFLMRSGTNATLDISESSNGQTLCRMTATGGAWDGITVSENGAFVATARRDLVQLWGIGTRPLGRYDKEDLQRVQELLRASSTSLRSANLRLLVELIEAAVIED